MKGISFLSGDNIESPFDSDDISNHLRIVISDPDPEYNVLVVGVSSQKEGIFHDPACELNKGDHPFIKKPSYISYRHAQVLNYKKIIQAGLDKVIIMKENISESVLNSIQNGARETSFLKRDFKKYFEYF